MRKVYTIISGRSFVERECERLSIALHSSSKPSTTGT